MKKPNKKEKLRHSDDGCDTLADMLPKFAKKGLFNIHKFNCGESEDELRAALEAKKAKYQRECCMTSTPTSACLRPQAKKNLVRHVPKGVKEILCRLVRRFASSVTNLIQCFVQQELRMQVNSLLINSM